MTKVALVGFGTVGSSVAKALTALPHAGLELTHIYNRGIARKQASDAAQYVPPTAVWTESIEDVLASDADVLVELMGGMQPAGEWIERALAAGKSVVTANKQLIAYRGAALSKLARKHNVQLIYGAAVAGGIIGAGGEIAWPQPTRPGDVLQVFSEILAVTPSRSRPERGTITVRSETRNQRGEVLQVLTARLVVMRRDA